MPWVRWQVAGSRGRHSRFNRAGARQPYHAVRMAEPLRAWSCRWLNGSVPFMRTRGGDGAGQRMRPATVGSPVLRVGPPVLRAGSWASEVVQADQSARTAIPG
jgi:hypothetical protein